MNPLFLAPLAFAGAANQLGPKAAAIVVERSNPIVNVENLSPEGILKAKKLMDDMRRNAQAIRLMKKEL